MRSLFGALIPLVLGACAAHMVSNPSAINSYGPVNAAERGGEIKYKATGALALARRQDAYKQMYQACSGSYRIDGESEKPGATYTFSNSHTNATASGVATTTYQPGGSTTHGTASGESNTTASAVTVQSEYRYIHFTCVPVTVPATAPIADSAKP